jgi:uncharacterized protein (TIGR02328 family)
MRIWDISPKKLCRQHLLGEHRELHAILSVISKKKKGYSRHPETLRWQGKLKALYLRHEKLVEEMKQRKYQHKSRFPKQLAKGSSHQNKLINTISEQLKILQAKKCGCKV